MTTSAGSPQIAVRAPGTKRCPRHYGKEVVFYCKNCDTLVCAECKIHECQEHVFEGISKVIPNATQKIQEFITRAELTEIPGIQGKLQAADTDVVKNKNHFKNQIRKIRNQNEALKKELDNITEVFVKTCQAMEQQNLDELQNYKRNLQTRIDKLTSQIKDVIGGLQSRNDILVFDLSNVIQSEFADLPNPICSTPEFEQGKLSVHTLEQLLGKLNHTVQNQSLNLPGSWKVMSTFTLNTRHGVRSIHRAATGNQAWLSLYNPITTRTVEKMLLTDQFGQAKQTTDMEVPVYDFCLSPHTGNIWFCSDQDNNVREVRGDNSAVRFTTDSVSCCICVTKDDHIIIGHYKQIVKYTQAGQVICRTSGGYPPDVRTPFHISLCPLTSNLAVVDLDMKEEGGNYQPFVSILNDQFQPLYSYTGEGQRQQSPPNPFQPRDLFFTNAGELVITDRNNKSVVLVTGTGRYLTTLFTDPESSPVAVCVDSHVIWVSFKDGSVKVLRNI